jgi:hypothetical protein
VGWLGWERVAGGVRLGWGKGSRLGLLAWPVGKLFLPFFFNVFFYYFSCFVLKHFQIFLLQKISRQNMVLISGQRRRE